MSTIEVPEAVRSGELHCIVSISGGKDSTACALALREAGVPFKMVFADTAWEAPETYEHLDHLRQQLGPIDVVRAAPAGREVTGVDEQGAFAIDQDGHVHRGGMVDRIRHRAGFPARMQRWCTRELKLEPLRAYHDRFEAETGSETVCVMGVRAAESKARAKMAMFVDEPAGDRSWGGWLWRPILPWSVEDVLAIHHRHGVQVNPLYRMGHGRVGCYPCIFANKEQVRLLAKHSPKRIDEIRALETEVSAIREARNSEAPGRYENVQGSFFQSAGADGFTPIDAVVLWSKTDRGGRQLPLLAPTPKDGCMLWGMCDPPVPSASSPSEEDAVESDGAAPSALDDVQDRDVHQLALMQEELA